MIALLKRHWISISLLVVTSIIGLVVVLNDSPIDIWLIDYEFNTEAESELTDFEKVDTVFQFNGVVCRNFTSSVADTLVDEGIRRHELKVYYTHPSKDKITQFSDEVLASNEVQIVNHRFRETQRKKRAFLYWVLFGFFLGMVAEFMIALKKKPGTN